MNFHNRLKKLREEKDVKQKDVAFFVGVSERVYGYYEKDRFPSDPDVLNKIANYFDVSTDYLLGNTDDPETKLIAFKDIPELSEFEGYFEVWKELKAEQISPDDIKRIALIYLELEKKKKST